jgi:predicted RNase H-like HicB family nuclease
MSTITLYPSARASSTSRYTRVSLKPDPRTSPQQSVTQPTIFISIAGLLPGGRWLTYPIVVKIQDDDGEYVVTELKYYMHGAGSTISEAIEAFKRIFSGYLDVLSEEEDNLSSYLHEQLEYLRSAIRTE